MGMFDFNAQLETPQMLAYRRDRAAALADQIGRGQPSIGSGIGDLFRGLSAGLSNYRTDNAYRTNTAAGRANDNAYATQLSHLLIRPPNAPGMAAPPSNNAVQSGIKTALATGTSPQLAFYQAPQGPQNAGTIANQPQIGGGIAPQAPQAPQTAAQPLPPPDAAQQPMTPSQPPLGAPMMAQNDEAALIPKMMEILNSPWSSDGVKQVVQTRLAGMMQRLDPKYQLEMQQAQQNLKTGALQYEQTAHPDQIPLNKVQAANLQQIQQAIQTGNINLVSAQKKQEAIASLTEGMDPKMKAMVLADPDAFLSSQWAMQMMGVKVKLLDNAMGGDGTPPAGLPVAPTGPAAMTPAPAPTSSGAPFPPSGVGMSRASVNQPYDTHIPASAPAPGDVAAAGGLPQATGLPNFANTPIPDAAKRAVKFATMTGGDAGSALIKAQDTAVANARDTYFHSPAYLNLTDYQKKLYEAKTKPVMAAIDAGANARATERMLVVMKDIVDNHWQDVTSGPGADAMLRLKQLAHATLGMDLGDNAKFSEVYSKLNMQLAALNAKDFTSRPTQFELGAFQRNNPGLSMDKEGNAALLNLKLQQARNERMLSDALIRKGVSDDPDKAIAFIDQWNKEHPVISPWDGKPLTNDTKVPELQVKTDQKPFPGAPPIGFIDKGWKYTGGDNHKQSSWVKVQ